MPSSKTPFSMRISGTYFGVKVNVSYKEFGRIKRQMNITNSQLLNKLRPMFKARLEHRIPKLIEQLQNGLQGLIGTKAFESQPNGHNHKPHKQIPDPLTRIVEHGYRYSVSGSKDKLGVEIVPKRNRVKQINYHNRMGKTPRVYHDGYTYGSKSSRRGVLQGLDDTCLPFFDHGHHGRIVQKWLENSQIGMAFAIDAFLKGQPDDKEQGNI